MRPSWVEVDLSAIRHNASVLAGVADPAQLCAVVKADGYGHGDVPAAEAALDGGATWLAVALLEEGIRLREAGIDAPILLLSEPPAEDAATIAQWSLTPTAYRRSFVEALSETGADVAVHVKLDTGMHRVGADTETAVQVIDAITAARNLSLGGVWTHMAVAEENAAFTGHQLGELEAFVAAVERNGTEVPMVHAANSAATLSFPPARRDLVRCGLALYGYRPAPDIAPELDLRPAMAVRSQVSLVRRLPAGARPSYGRRRPLPKDANVATVPIGYADGFTRLLGDREATVLINGVRYPLAGRVTMDHLVVDCGDDEVAPGDEVTLLGSQGAETITADEWAERLDTISYEILCDFGPRLPRRYSE